MSGNRLRLAVRLASIVLSVCLCGASVPAGSQLSPLQAYLLTANQKFLNNFEIIKRHGGHDLAADIAGRFTMDESEADSAPAPGYSAAAWMERMTNVAHMDSTLVDELVDGRQSDFRGKMGLFEGVFKVNADGTLQPYALYVPASYYHAKSHSLVILLHGQPQTESEILAAPFFRNLADRTGTVIAAPYGRGLYNFPYPANVEVYELLDAVLAMFPIDAQRVFLAGYSMGGFSVFRVAPLHPQRWAGVMCIAGAVLNSEANVVQFSLRSTPIYVVTGAHDSVIPPGYGEATAIWLSSVGIPTEFNEEPSGDHWLGTLQPSLQIAWDDMTSGVIHARTPAERSVPRLPSQTSAVLLKP